MTIMHHDFLATTLTNTECNTFKDYLYYFLPNRKLEMGSDIVL